MLYIVTKSVGADGWKELPLCSYRYYIDYRTTFERGFLEFAQWVAGSLVSHVHHLRLVKL